ncbi:type II secretion system protein GspL [Thiohalophilus sp.]|uniref:type II secretion system protein GspL n=1 Tax=Thiohalophilus sp. TaxID=3028392 RepID=UPI002ACDC5D2|nr:type II secretion system protein GspL [Thiohalophilus sp.]MDZ7662392.1 type II secretion system protein GspL [Thiohalophilus sp.]
MPEQLILHLPAASDGSYEYAVINVRGELEHQARSGSDNLHQALAGRRCFVVVPGTDVLITRVNLPTRRRDRIAQALPYTLEDRLIGDINDFHFASSLTTKGPGLTAAVVDHERMQTWEQALAQLAITPIALIPENGILPLDTQQWHILADEQRVLLQLGNGSYTLEPDAALLTLEAALQEMDDDDLPAHLEIEAPQTVITRLQSVLAAHPEVEDNVAINTTTSDMPLLPRLASRLNERQVVNLLQGAYARQARWDWVWRPLRPAAALLVVWLLAQYSVQFAQTQRLQAERDQRQTAIETIYRDTFPDSRVVNPQVQMRQHLAALESTQDDDNNPRLSNLLALAGPALAGDDTQLRSLRLRDGRLEVDLSAPSIESLERIREKLAAYEGLVVELRSASTRGKRADGRLLIRGEAT